MADEDQYGPSTRAIMLTLWAIVGPPMIITMYFFWRRRKIQPIRGRGSYSVMVINFLCFSYVSFNCGRFIGVNGIGNCVVENLIGPVHNVMLGVVYIIRCYRLWFKGGLALEIGVEKEQMRARKSSAHPTGSSASKIPTPHHGLTPIKGSLEFNAQQVAQINAANAPIEQLQVEVHRASKIRLFNLSSNARARPSSVQFPIDPSRPGASNQPASDHAAGAGNGRERFRSSSADAIADIKPIDRISIDQRRSQLFGMHSTGSNRSKRSDLWSYLEHTWFMRHRLLNSGPLLTAAYVIGIALGVVVPLAIIFEVQGVPSNPPRCSSFAIGTYIAVSCFIMLCIFIPLGLKLRHVSENFQIKQELIYASVGTLVAIILYAISIYTPATSFPLARFASYLASVIFWLTSAVWPLLKTYNFELPLRKKPQPPAIIKYTLQEVLEDPEGAALFAEHLKTEFSLENLVFWESVQDYRALCESPEVDESTRFTLAIEVYDACIRSGSPFEVNLPYVIQVPLKDAIFPQRPADVSPESPAPLVIVQPNVFDAAQKCIFDLMSTDSYVRFQQTAVYGRYARARSGTESPRNVGTLRGTPKAGLSPISSSGPIRLGSNEDLGSFPSDPSDIHASPRGPLTLTDRALSAGPTGSLRENSTDGGRLSILQKASPLSARNPLDGASRRFDVAPSGARGLRTHTADSASMHMSDIDARRQNHATSWLSERSSVDDSEAHLLKQFPPV